MGNLQVTAEIYTNQLQLIKKPRTRKLTDGPVARPGRARPCLCVCVHMCVRDWPQHSVVFVRAFNQVTESPDPSAPTLPCLEGLR